MAKYTAKMMAADLKIEIGDLRRYLKVTCKKKGRFWEWKSKKAAAADIKRVKAYMKPSKAKMGRPTGYTQKIADEICELIARGKSLASICKDPNMPAESSVYQWKRDHIDFTDSYKAARADAADFHVEEILEISDNAGSIVMVDGVPLMDADGNPVMQVDAASIAHARLRTDSRKWVAARFNPAYQEKTIIEDVTPMPTPEQRKQRIDDLLIKANI